MIGSSENRISYNGNGIATEFAYTFKILEKSDVKVLHVAIDGTEELLTTDYYVDMDKSVVLYPGYAPGAEIPEAERPPVLPEGERLVLYREVPITQESALDKHWPFNVIEAGLDKLTIICQQIFDKANRSLYASESVSKEFNSKVPIQAGKSFRISDDGLSFEVTEDPAKVIPTAKSLLSDTTKQANVAIENANIAQNAAQSAYDDGKALIEADKQAAAASAATAQAAAESAYNDGRALIESSVQAAASSASLAKDSESNALTSANNSATSELSAAESAQQAKQIVEGIGNPVVDVTEANGVVTVKKSNADINTFTAFPQGENDALLISRGGTGATNAYDACVNLDPAYKLYFIKSHPSYFYLPSLFTCTYTSVTLPKGIELNINGEAYISTVETTILISTIGTAAELAGKDVYIYATQGEGTEPNFVLSLNSTVPDGYTADNSRKIGGFHCECLAVGSLTNVDPVTGVTEAHKLTDLGTGEIIAPSRWDLWHKGSASQTEGLTYVDEADVWSFIYGASWDGTKLVSAFGGIWADGTSTKKWHGELSLEALMKQGFRLLWRYEFQMAAKGSNEQTAIKGASDPGTTGAHVDTAGRRMVSNYGLEDCCGVLWQWLMDLGFAGGSGWTKSAYASDVDPRSYGQTYGTLYRLLGGGYWGDSSSCGSRCALCNDPSASVHSNRGCRGASEPLHRKGEKRRPVY